MPLESGLHMIRSSSTTLMHSPDAIVQTVQFVSHTVVPPPLWIETITIGSAAWTIAAPSVIATVTATQAAARPANARRLSPEILSRAFIGSPFCCIATDRHALVGY